ncbi:unnamed protein product [Brassicogethes aeneus]|uniref:BEN domain-containing protein n=1 Tax=Brassicogethes aeneus TaxID=1431903 RepID=A0A9P0AZU8_BRAAE|nr:unnamed protein product [Brassicogethes aeneus]
MSSIEASDLRTIYEQMKQERNFVLGNLHNSEVALQKQLLTLNLFKQKYNITSSELLKKAESALISEDSSRSNVTIVTIPKEDLNLASTACFTPNSIDTSNDVLIIDSEDSFQKEVIVLESDNEIQSTYQEPRSEFVKNKNDFLSYNLSQLVPKDATTVALTEEQPSKKPRLQSMEVIEIGSNGTQMDEQKYKTIKWDIYTKATRQLLDTFFTRDVLANSSLSGRPSPAFLNSGKTTKKPLDKNIIEDIVACVSKNCNVLPRMVRHCITSKCRSRKAFEAKS